MKTAAAMDSAADSSAAAQPNGGDDDDDEGDGIDSGTTATYDPRHDAHNAADVDEDGSSVRHSTSRPSSAVIAAQRDLVAGADFRLTLGYLYVRDTPKKHRAKVSSHSI